MLCMSVKNQLGKSIFPANTEAELLAAGYVFACKLPTKRVKALLVCKRPITDAVTDGELDDPRVPLAFAAATAKTSFIQQNTRKNGDSHE